MVERRLAAILAADVVGYSRMMGVDEAGVLAALRALRSDLFDPAIARHHGRIVKLMGDGTLVEFGSVVDAVSCAAEVQSALKDRNAGLPDDQRLDLRIGINLGDVMVEGEDLYGDGVNVAARLEGLADPGGICVSEDVVRQASGKVPAGFEDLGEQHLKNIETPVRVFRVVEQGADIALKTLTARKPPRWTMAAAAVFALAVATGAGWIAFAPTESPAINVNKVLNIKGPAIAALPLTNIGGDPEHEEFVSGLSDELSAALTRFVGIRVLSSRATAKYADDLDALKAKLDADYLLEGSVRKRGDSIRLTSILIKVPSGDQIWTETYDFEISSETVPEVEERVAGTIAGKIAGGSRGVIKLDRVADQPIRQAFDDKDLECLNRPGQNSPAENLERNRCLTQSVELDPGYVMGWIGLADNLADIYFFDFLLFGVVPVTDPLPEMLSAAHKAVQLAPDSADAHNSLAVAAYYNDDQRLFRAEFAKVIELNPNDAGAISWLATLLAWSGQWDEGVALVEKALAFNPSVVSPGTWHALAKAHYVQDEYAKALDDFQQVWARYPGFYMNDLQRAYLYADWGEQEKAEAAVAALLKQRPDFVVEDAGELYRGLRFQESYIDKMVAALKKAGLPSREDQT